MRVAELSQVTRKEASLGFLGSAGAPDRDQAPPVRRERKAMVISGS